MHFLQRGENGQEVSGVIDKLSGSDVLGSGSCLALVFGRNRVSRSDVIL